VPTVFKQGERYQITATVPAGLGSYGTQTAMQSALDQVAPGEFKIASVSVSGTSATVVVDVVGPNFTVPALVTTEVSAAIMQGVSFSVADMGPTPSGAGAADLQVSGPYNPVTQMQVGKTYLISMAPIAGSTLATQVQQLTASGTQVANTVSQSWDVNQVPSGWPSSDSNPNEWRMVITYVSGPGPQAPAEATIFTTGGSTT
jgi:hypothetical protein